MTYCWMSFINQYICRIFPTQPNIIVWTSMPVAVVKTNKANNSMHAKVTIINMNTSSHNAILSDEFNLCLVLRQVQFLHIQERRYWWVTGAWIYDPWDPLQCFGLPFFMTVRGLTDILRGSLFNLYIVCSMDKPIKLQKFMTFVTQSDALTWIMHTKRYWATLSER